MSNVGKKDRSFLPIKINDLKKLATVAREDRESFFRTHPKWAKLYADRVFCTALCQGAAKHFVDRKTGINDFDIYTFYKRNPKKPWYAKRIKAYDFGNLKFGKSAYNPKSSKFIGRRVDCMGRDIDFVTGENIVAALRRYLGQGATKSAKLLAKKAVVLLEPHCGKVVWE